MSTPDFFRARLDAMIDLRHPLAVLVTHMQGGEIEKSLAQLFARKAPKQTFEREGQTLRRKAADYAHARQFRRRPCKIHCRATKTW